MTHRFDHIIVSAGSAGCAPAAYQAERTQRTIRVRMVGGSASNPGMTIKATHSLCRTGGLIADSHTQRSAA